MQNPENKKEILCDEKLKTIFEGKEKISFLEIGKMLSRHFVKTNWPLFSYLGLPNQYYELAHLSILNWTHFNDCSCYAFCFWELNSLWWA